MIADVAPGQPYTAAFNLTDANDSPLAGAVLAGGLLTVYGPGSAATPVAGPSVVADLGGGDYGLGIAGSALTTQGFYTFSIPTITVGTATFADLVGGFSVGTIPPEYKTYRALVVGACRALGCGLTGTTTAPGTTTTLIDNRWINSGYATNEFAGDELLILEPTTGDTNPVLVTGFNPATGAFTFSPAITGPPSGTDYLLIRAGTGGIRFAQLAQAVAEAVADLATRQRVSDEVTLTTAYNTRRYAVPASWTAVTRVQINFVAGSTDEYWETFPPADYEYWADRQLLLLKRWLPGGYPLRLEGAVGVAAPTRLGQVVRLPHAAVVRWVSGYLGLPPAQRAGLLVQSARAGLLRGGR